MLWICRDKMYEESMPSKRTISSYKSSFGTNNSSHSSANDWWKRKKTELELTPAYQEWQRKHNEELIAYNQRREEQKKKRYEERWKPSLDVLQPLRDAYLQTGSFPENKDPSTLDFVTQQEEKEDYGCDEMRRMRFEIMKKAAIKGDLATMKRIQFQEGKLGDGWAISSEHGRKYDDEDGRHIIFYAMYAGQLEAVAFILSIDEEACNARGSGSETPLWWAVTRCLHSTTSTKQKETRRALQQLLDYKHTQFFQENTDFGSKTVLHITAEEGNVELFRLLLEGHTKRGYSKDELVGSQDEDGRTCLHSACYHGHPSVVEFMLSDGESGCRPSLIKDNEQWLKNMKDNQGKTPLDLAKLGAERLASTSSKEEEKDSDDDAKEKLFKQEEFNKVISILEKMMDSGCVIM